MLTVTKKHPEDKHDHVVFYTTERQVDPDTGEDVEIYIGETSVDKGHSHKVISFTDPVTRQVRLIAQASEEANHTHDIPMEYPYFKKPNKRFAEKTQGDRIAEILELHTSLESRDKDNFDRHAESEEFYAGEQWTEEEIAYLNAHERACLTINKTESYVDELCGYEAEDDTDFMYQPKSQGKQVVADILNIVKKHVENKNDFKKRVRGKIFRDLVIGGKSNLNFRMDYSRDIYGDLILERFPYNKVKYAEHDDDYGRDCPANIKSKKVTLDQAINEYPEAAKKIQQDWKTIENADALVNSVEDGTDYPIYDRDYGYLSREHMNIAYADRQVLILEVNRRSYHSAPIVICMTDGTRYDGFGWRKKDIKRFKEFVFSEVIDRKSPKVRKTVVVGGYIVEDIDPAPLPGDESSVFPVYAKRLGNKYWSKVHSAKDAQLELNKRKSQSVDLANHSLGGVWMYDESTFNGEQRLEQEFTDNVATPNAAIKVFDLSNPPIRKDPAPLPAAVLQAATDADITLRDLFNIKVDPTGSHQSHAHLMEVKRSKLIGNNFLFDAMDGMLRRYGELLLNWIQTYFEPEQIAKIVQADTREEATINGQPAAGYTAQDIIGFLESEDLTRYDVDIVPGKYKESFRLAKLGMFIEMQQSGMGVPYATLIEHLDIPAPEKAKMMQQHQQQQEQAMQESKANRDVEIQKTLIAHGTTPPRIKKEMLDQSKAVMQELQQERQQQNSVGSNGIPNIGG